MGSNIQKVVFIVSWSYSEDVFVSVPYDIDYAMKIIIKALLA